MPSVSYVLTTKDRFTQAENFRKNIEALKRDGDEFIVVDASEIPYSDTVFGGIADNLIIEPDTSIRHGLNKGILAAQHDYIKLLMDDDWFVPEGTWAAFDIMHQEGVLAMQAGGKRWRSEGHPVSVGKYDSITDPGVNWGSETWHVPTYGATGVGQFFHRDAFARAGIIDTRYLLWDMELMARMIDSGVNVKYCRLYTYEHPLTSESTLGDPKFDAQIRRENIRMHSQYGINLQIAQGRSWKHQTKESAQYDGGFS